MYIPIFSTWKEQVTPILYFKEDCILACKLKTFGTAGSTSINWFGNIYGFRHFSRQKTQLYSFSDELIMVVFEILNTFLFARFYLILCIVILLLLLEGILDSNLGVLVVGAILAIVVYSWPKFCFSAYKRFVEQIPLSKGWKMLPLINKENIHEAEKIVSQSELEKWIKS